jgi:uncharacterized protein (TIGR02172 family)
MNTGILIGHGSTADIFKLEGGYVLKLYKSCIPKGNIECEYGNTRLMGSCGVRTPEAIKLIEHDGRSGIVLKYITGKSLRELMLNPFTIKKYSKMLARLQYQMHQKKNEGLPRLKELVAENIKKAPILSDQQKLQVLKLLSSIPDGNSICHGDFYPGNIMISKNGAVILDWMMAGSGAPAADVARTTLLLLIPQLPEGSPWLKKMVYHKIRQTINRFYLEEYCRLSKVIPADIIRWTIPIAAASLIDQWSAAEEQQLYAMIVKGLAS